MVQPCVRAFRHARTTTLSYRRHCLSGNILGHCSCVRCKPSNLHDLSASRPAVQLLVLRLKVPVFWHAQHLSDNFDDHTNLWTHTRAQLRAHICVYDKLAALSNLTRAHSSHRAGTTHARATNLRHNAKLQRLRLPPAATPSHNGGGLARIFSRIHALTIIKHEHARRRACACAQEVRGIPHSTLR